eukprot:c29312_g2_i1 orf=312-3491(+)
MANSTSLLSFPFHGLVTAVTDCFSWTSQSLMAVGIGNLQKFKTNSLNLTASKCRFFSTKSLNEECSRRHRVSRWIVVECSGRADINGAPLVDANCPSLEVWKNNASFGESVVAKSSQQKNLSAEETETLKEHGSSADEAEAASIVLHTVEGERRLKKVEAGALSVKREKFEPLSSAKRETSKVVFPGGTRRAEVRLPGLVLWVKADEILGEGSKDFQSMVNSAVAGGFTIVVLESGIGEGVGGARLFEAACILKALLKGRAELLVSERVDIATAAGAGGVLLSDKGLPAVVARSMMESATAESSVLPLIARIIETGQSALRATASEGADLLILLLPEGAYSSIAVSNICNRASIPVFVLSSLAVPLSESAIKSSALELWKAGASGVVLYAKDMKGALREDALTFAATLVSFMRTTYWQKSVNAQSPTVLDQAKDSTVNGMEKDRSKPHLKTLDLQATEILEEERSLLASVIELVQEAAPEVNMPLLVDAMAQLDEPFLLVIVGEFNSGKSSVINALLGMKFLKEGVLPTTNEITVLKFTGNGHGGKEQYERHPNGHLVCYLPSILLEQMNIVDTPGTNAILQRQQRLTEDFVPRADLVLFVLSADRPLTESEMSFLRYIRQWGKKIIFILNKADIFSNVKELEDVLSFVRDNAQKLLSVEQTIVYPVSARQALRAKIAATSEEGVVDKDQLSQDPFWRYSGFDKLENFIKDFLDGFSDAGAERRQLKLETPIGIALALLSACEKQLSAEAAKSEADLKILDDSSMQIRNNEKILESYGKLQRQKILAMIEAAKIQAENFIDSVLQMSNTEAVSKYLLGGNQKDSLPVSREFEKEVIVSTVSDVRHLIKEYQSWLETNLSEQVNTCKELVSCQLPHLKFGLQQAQLSNAQQPSQVKNSVERQVHSIAVLDEFDTTAATILLEQELKEVVLSTFGGLGAAGVSASFLTSILPTTLEDLIALGICSAGGLFRVWNLPMRRETVKKKVQRVADSLSKQLNTAMELEFKGYTERLNLEVNEVIGPYLYSVHAEANKVKALQYQIQGVTKELQALQIRVQNLGTV